MVTFGDKDNMFERFVEIDACVFLEGTAHVASGFSVDGPRCSGFPPVLAAVPSAYEGPKLGLLEAQANIYTYTDLLKKINAGSTLLQVIALCFHSELTNSAALCAGPLTLTADSEGHCVTVGVIWFRE